MLKKNFCRSIISGGVRQAAIDNFEDLKHLTLLDDALWAVNSVPVSALRMNPEFPALLDFDHDGRIRCDEVRQAVDKVLTYFADGSGVNNASGELQIASLNPFAPEGEKLISSAKSLLAGFGRSGDGILTLEELRKERLIAAFSNRNGDGIIVRDDSFSEELNVLIDNVVSETGGTKDASGKTGASLDNLEKFLETAQKVLDWQRAPKTRPELLPFGENTAGYAAIWREVLPLLTDYFLNADCVDFLQGDDVQRLAKRTLTADPLDLDELKNTLDKAPLALPHAGEKLVLAAVNPLRREKLDLLTALPELKDYFIDGTLTKENFRQLKARFALYFDYQTAKVQGKWFYEAGTDTLGALPQSAAVKEFRQMAAADLACAGAIADAEKLYNLTLLQKYLLEFLNNFVNLSRIFSGNNDSIWQQGDLVMDGRHYTLVMPVAELSRHKKIAGGSNVCTIYFKIHANTPEEKLLAAAVTDGVMGNLFPGKLGVFFPAGSRNACDAVIAEVLEAPVSFQEAVREPFRRLGQLIRRRAEKLLAKHSTEGEKTADKNMENLLQNGKAADSGKTPASGLPLLIMGGGIGLAAIGSAIAFIGSTLAGLSFWQVLGILGAIILIFGGPPVIISIIRLCNRNLGRFLEASGCAVNLQLKLTPQIARHFTVLPEFRRKFNWFAFGIKLVVIAVLLMLAVWKLFPAECRKICRQTGFGISRYCCFENCGKTTAAPGEKK